MEVVTDSNGVFEGIALFDGVAEAVMLAAGVLLDICESFGEVGVPFVLPPLMLSQIATIGANRSSM